MLNRTLEFLRCPVRDCGGPLRAPQMTALGPGEEIRRGELICTECQAKFPVLAGVAVLVEDVRGFLLSHVKGIARVVSDDEIPAPFRREFSRARRAIETEHIEDDLEAERVVALYFMNHYLRAGDGSTSPSWLRGDPLIEKLVREHWDRGPFAQIKKWLADENVRRPLESVIELGCGVGGLALELKPHTRSYLGIDSSFASIALARYLTLGISHAPRPTPGVRIPQDLLQGSVSLEISHPVPIAPPDGSIDFIVGELENLPVRRATWSASVSLNTIDMLVDPALLPELQSELAGPQGVVIQSSPYVWHESVASKLRERLPAALRADSASAVEWLYQQAGLEIEAAERHLPWLFYKHARQLEIYSVHLLQARKKDGRAAGRSIS